MKIIFLDIDGVICNQSCWKQQFEKDNEHPFDDECVSLLDEIVNKTNAKIVISSSWRNGDLERMRDIFKVRGCKNYESIIGETGRKDDCPRGWEIRDWMIRQKIIFKRDIDNYVIIDDDIDMLYEQRDNFVNTNTYKGLTNKDAEKAIKILNL